MTEIDDILRSLEYAPAAEGLPMAAGLRGWRTPEGNFLCVRCAARIFARGATIPKQSTPVWHDSPIPGGVCVGHTPTSDLPPSGNESFMKQFSVTDKQRHAAIVDRLHEKRDDLTDAIAAYNREIAQQYEGVRDAAEAFQSIIEEANTFLDGVRDDAQAFFDDRSEKWQEGEAGEALQEWINELENNLDDIEVEAPETMSEPDFDMIDNFEGVRQGVDA